MGGSVTINELVAEVLRESFDNPSSFPVLIDKKVTRNRSLRSAERRSLSNLLHDAMRWRRRLWGEISPASVRTEQIYNKLDEANRLGENPPMAKWSNLSMDALARELSFPTWVVEKWVRHFGFQEAVSLCLSLNQPAPITLRLNSLKVDREKLLKKLSGEGFRVRPGKHSPWAVRLLERKNIKGLPEFKRGWFEFQDEGSQLIALATEASPREIIVDACTGAGGKALAIGAMLQGEGEIHAIDSDARKLEELKKRAKRAGVKKLKAVWAAPDDPNPCKELLEGADCVLVDPPCSNFGVLRRSPWLKWSLPFSIYESFPVKQTTLLGRYSQYVKPKGRLVYATCTFNPLENSGVVEHFLKTHSQFFLKDSKLLRPDIEGTDGFFIANMARSS